MIKRLLLLLTVLALVGFVGCRQAESDTTSYPEVTVTLPKDDTVNGYRVSRPNRPAESVSETTLYYANTQSHIFHKSDCATGKRIRNERLWVAEDRDALIAEGYVPCQICQP